MSIYFLCVSVTFSQLLDCFVIPVVLLLSWFFLLVRYKGVHFVGAGLCLLGIGCMVGADVLLGRQQGLGEYTYIHTHTHTHTHYYSTTNVCLIAAILASLLGLQQVSCSRAQTALLMLLSFPLCLLFSLICLGEQKLFGDLLVLGGATLCGISNVCEEFIVKNMSRVEFLGMMGLFGSFFSGIQL